MCHVGWRVCVGGGGVRWERKLPMCGWLLVVFRCVRRLYMQVVSFEFFVIVSSICICISGSRFLMVEIKLFGDILGFCKLVMWLFLCITLSSVGCLLVGGR